MTSSGRPLDKADGDVVEAVVGTRSAIAAMGWKSRERGPGRMRARIRRMWVDMENGGGRQWAMPVAVDTRCLVVTALNRQGAVASAMRG